MNKNKKEQPNEIDFFKTICKILDDCYYVCLITKKKKSVLNIAIKNIELKKDENLHEFPNFLKSEDSNKVYVDNILYLRDQIDKDIKIHCDKSFKKVYLSKNKLNVDFNETCTKSDMENQYLLVLWKINALIHFGKKLIKFYIEEISESDKDEIVQNNFKIFEIYLSEINKFLLENDNFEKIGNCKSKIDSELDSFEDLRYFSLELSISNLLFNAKKEPLLLKYKKIRSMMLIHTNSVEIHYCENVIQYQKQIFELQKDYKKSYNGIRNSPNIIYFRGNKLNYDLSASLYRGDNHNIKLEHIINNRIIQNMPDNFLKCETFFDKLTILKHFNCPSRLIDITENPLIAAFFALDHYSSEESSDYGVINLCYPRNFDKVKNSSNSDTISLFSALCTTKKALILDIDELKNRLVSIYNITLKSFEELSSTDKANLYTKIDLLGKLISIMLKSKNLESSKKLLDELKRNIVKLIDNISDEDFTKNNYREINNEIDKWLKNINSVEFFNNENTFFKELQHQAELINPTFRVSNLSISDIDSYLIVHPSLNNKRILNQQGLFILIGSSLDDNFNLYKPSSKYLELFEDRDNKRQLFIIKNRNNEFYESLDENFGINKGFIYPDLERQITQIKNNINKEYKNYDLD